MLVLAEFIDHAVLWTLLAVHRYRNTKAPQSWTVPAKEKATEPLLFSAAKNVVTERALDRSPDLTDLHTEQRVVECVGQESPS